MSAEVRAWGYSTPYVEGGRISGEPTGVGVDDPDVEVTIGFVETHVGRGVDSAVFEHIGKCFLDNAIRKQIHPDGKIGWDIRAQRDAHPRHSELINERVNLVEGRLWTQLSGGRLRTKHSEKMAELGGFDDEEAFADEVQEGNPLLQFNAVCVAHNHLILATHYDAVENLLNRVMNKTLPASAAVSAAVRDAVQALPHTIFHPSSQCRAS